MKKILSFISLGLVTILLTSCATIVSGRTQNMSVLSNPSSAIVTLEGQKQQTPCTLILDRKHGSYEVLIEKEGYEPVRVVLKKVVNGWVFGNIIFGGIIGLVIDISTGSVNAFTPSEIEINLISKAMTYLPNKDLLIVKLTERHLK